MQTLSHLYYKIMLHTHSFSHRERERERDRDRETDRQRQRQTEHTSFITDLCLDHAISLVSQLRHNVKQVQLQPIIMALVTYLFTSTTCTCWHKMISNCTLTLSISQVKMFNNNKKQDLFLLQLQDCLPPQKTYCHRHTSSETQNENERRKCKELV